MSHVVSVPELLDGHTVLDVECLDRIYLNGYVPTLQVGGQVFTFLHDHRGMPVASRAVFGQIGGRFRQVVARVSGTAVSRSARMARPPAPDIVSPDKITVKSSNLVRGRSGTCAKDGGERRRSTEPSRAS
jgi:hypothetical protein